MSADTSRPASWKWTVCGLLLLATMLNYMDRQTLAQTITTISKELRLDEAHYGQLEMGFGLAFALGGITSGFLVDRLSVRWLFPFYLAGWSLAGVATAYANNIGTSLAASLAVFLRPETAWLGEDLVSGQAFLGLMVCRITLGFFEAGMWPCALVTTQRILSRQERSLGNSVLQSGASIGAIFTPLIVQVMVTGEAGSWRGPFVIIGLMGLLWMVPWWSLIRKGDLTRPQKAPEETPTGQALVSSPGSFWQRFLVLMVVVITINITWQFFRAWLPRFLLEQHRYEQRTVNYFTSAYYIATDVGCLGVGAAVRWLTWRGWEVHSARLSTFFLCALLTALSMLIPILDRGPLLLGLFLLIGAGALGLYPNFYALTQELSYQHQGKVTGILGATTWVVTSILQGLVGQHIKETQSYAAAMLVAGLMPLIAFLAVWLFWKPAAVADMQAGSKER